MFGVNRPVRFGEDCRKENSNRQPTVQTSSAAPTKRGTLQLQAQDPLRAADQPDRDYIASMDQAFAGHIKDAALSKKEPRPSSVPEKRLGSKKQDRQQALPGACHLDDELTLHEFQTLAEFTFGLPRHVLTFTNKRLVVEQRFRLLGTFGKSLHQTVQYRHIVDVGIGPTSKTAVLIGSAALCILALLSYVILRAFGAEQPAIGILVTCVVGAVLVTLYAILVDHFAEGVNLRIETCKGWNQGMGWPGMQVQQASATHIVRLPAADAMQAMLILLQHPAVSIWGDNEIV